MHRLMTAEGVEAALRGAGLVGIALHPVTHDWAFPDTAWLRDHAHRLFAFAPWWTALDAGEQSQLTEEMIARSSNLPRPAVPSTAVIAVGTRPA